MGLLVDGVWQDRWYDTTKTGGRFERQASSFRNWVTPDGSPGRRAPADSRPRAGVITSTSRSPALGPTARFIFRKLKRLEDVISVSVVSYHMGPEAGPSMRRPARPATA